MKKEEWHKILTALGWPLLFVAVCWVVWLLDTSQKLNLTEYGIGPKSFSGLRGIFFSPFLHDDHDIAHILNNTTPFLFLGWALFYFYKDVAWKTLLAIWVLGGFWVWLAAGEGSIHVGASGLLYGLASFLFYSGVIRRQTNLMGLTMLVVFLYGGMIWGIFPYDIRISWQGHLFGGISGLLMAIYFRKSGWQREKYEWEAEEVKESFSELSQKHESALVAPPEEQVSNENPVISVNYEYKPKE